MNKNCLICLKPVLTKGYCTIHYQRFRKFSDPLKVILPKERKMPNDFVPWNKGKLMPNSGYWKNKNLSTEHKLKLSLSHLGKTPWNKTVSDVKCTICNNVFHKKPSHIKKHNFCSKKCHNEWMKIIMNTKEKIEKMRIINYKGISPLNKLIKGTYEYKQWRKNIFERDNWKCIKCNIKGSLYPHHKKSFAQILREFLRQYSQFSPIDDKDILVRLSFNYEPFWDVNNGETLCKDCHKLTSTYGRNIKEINYGI